MPSLQKETKIIKKLRNAGEDLAMMSKEERKEYRKKYYQAHLEEEREGAKRYRKTHKKEGRERARKWREANREKEKERSRKYRKDYPEEAREAVRKYYEAHYEESKERGRKYYAARLEERREYGRKYWATYPKSPEEVRERNRKYYRANSEKVKECNIKYEKARYLSDEGFAVKQRLRKLLQHAFRHYSKTGKLLSSRAYGIDFSAIVKYLGPCPGDRKLFHIDHIRPLSSFDFNDLEQVKQAFAPWNHRWLLAEENLSKGNRFEGG